MTIGPHALSPDCGGAQPQDFKDVQDRIAWVVDTFSGDELALLYDTLYKLGHRKDYCDTAIRRIKDRFKTP